MAGTVADTLTQLEAARQLALSDATHYAMIVPGILPIVGAQAHLDIRRWGADFLAEAFASPVVTLQVKEGLSIQPGGPQNKGLLLETLRGLLEFPGQDTWVLKSVIQVTASIYGLVFRYIINNPQDSDIWSHMLAIKSAILKKWDTAVTGVRVCCIKFVERVVTVQTPGVIADPRRPEKNEISLAIVPRDHPLIPPPNLEAEASGLLDRLLNVFYESSSNAVLINATLNCISTLVRTRPPIANKIISTVLSFDPMKLVKAPMTPKLKVQIKSLERTTRAFLMNIYRRNENGPFAGRIKQYVDRLTQSRLEIVDESSRKRGAPSDGPDGSDNAKRARLGADLNGRSSVPPLPPGPTSFAQLFTLTNDEGLQAFDVTMLPVDLIVRITVPIYQSIDSVGLDAALNAIRSRMMMLSHAQQAAARGPPQAQPTSVMDEEDDYEPDFEPKEDMEQVLNRDGAPQTNASPVESRDLALGPFKLPQPPPLTGDEAEQWGKVSIKRVFSMVSKLDDPTRTAKRPGLHRLAGSTYDKDAWITVVTRLATRTLSGLYNNDDEIKREQPQIGALALPNDHSLGDGIRETLWKYIIEDFRVRLDIAISWLNEEWYNDRIAQMQSRSSSQDEPIPVPQNYEKWVLKVLDGIVPYLDAKDKVLIRFLSEIPQVSEAVLQRIKNITRDPDRVTLAVNAIHYLVLLKPPVREMCIDALEDLWRNYDDARIQTRKLLARWRPHVLEQNNDMNGVKQEVKESQQELKQPSIEVKESPAEVKESLLGPNISPSGIPTPPRTQGASPSAVAAAG